MLRRSSGISAGSLSRCTVLCSLALVASTAFAQTAPPAGVLSPKGPLPYRNSEPLNTPFLLPPPIDGRILADGKGRFDFNLDIVNNLLTIGKSNAPKYVVDFEEQRFYFGYARGFGHGQELGLRLSYIDRDGGFMDRFIDKWHRIFGFQGGGRAGLPVGRTLFGVNNAAGQTIINDNHSRSGMGDTLLEYRYALATLPDDVESTRRISASARVLLKLPTGKKEFLLGSGKMDVGFGLAATARPLRNLALHGNSTLVFLGKPDIANLAPRRTQPHTLLGAEYLFDGRTSVVFQTDDNPAPFHSGLSYTDRPRRSFTYGFWRQIGKGKQIYIANSENDFGALAKNAPDFVLSLGTRLLIR